MKVSDIGEFPLIERLAEIASGEPPADLVAGIGDDAAVWRLGDRYLVATTDAMVEGVHFLARPETWRDAGWKALAVNVSDIAAMGARPLFALVTLALPPETSVSDIEDLYRGLRECAEAYGLAIIGGDIVQAPQVAISIVATGEALIEGGQPLLLRRDGAREGDAIAVTGTLGASAAGLRRLKEGARPARPSDPLVKAHMRPQPRVEAGLAAVQGGIRCGIDISDGLLQDLGHICEMSGLGAEVRAESIPVSEEARSVYPDDALALACGGGEDYELVLVGPETALKNLSPALDVPLTIIGRMTGGDAARLIGADGNEVQVAHRGWDQLKSDE